MRAGVLALQGGFAAHLACLALAGYRAAPVRHAEQIAGLDLLVLPGGESSAQRDLCEGDLLAAITAFERPIAATCAGCILLAREVDPRPRRAGLALLDVAVQRNAYGPQINSRVALSDDGRNELVFIRAARITRGGADVEVLARYGATYHPELGSSPASSVDFYRRL